jgi:CDP-glucose 4,6-dehydratase
MHSGLLATPRGKSGRTNAQVTNKLTKAFSGRRVIVTGHTGFKGSWLAEWLLALGSEVFGYALPPSTFPSHFELLDLARRLPHTEGDVRNPASVNRIVADVQPDFIFHLAAQPLVRLSYAEPVETFTTNVMGTINVLEAARRLSRPCVVVIITTDKCYLNREWLYGYREEDALGGRDPYSASKAAAEIATAAWRASFFSGDTPVKIATARAGNVIGGGDWAKDRIVPDCIRSLAIGEAISVRNAQATRPWQHVLEPLSGYLWLAASLASSSKPSNPQDSLESAFNFGPDSQSNRTVEELVELVLRQWPGNWFDASDPTAPHEARFLHLSTDKAARLLGWRPVWSFEQTIQKTVEWYSIASSSAAVEIASSSRRQIEEYHSDAATAALPWAIP